MPEQDFDNLPSANNSDSLESTLNKLEQALRVKGLQSNLPINITIGNTSVFKGVLGQEPTVNKITPEQAAILQKTLQDPRGLEGAVRIKVGNETVFHARNGKLEVDKLGLTTPQQAQTQSSPQQSNQNQSSQPTQAQPSQVTPPSLQEQISQLQSTIQQQQQQLEVLNHKLNRYSNSPIVAASARLSNWFGNLRDKVYSSGQEMVSQLSNQLQQNREKLSNKIQEMRSQVSSQIQQGKENITAKTQEMATQFRQSKENITAKTQEVYANTKENVVDGVHATRDRLHAKTSSVVLGAMTSATAKLASSIGEKLPDGSVVVENRNLNQRLEVSGNSVALKQRPQVDAQALWDKYSQDVSPERPIIRSQVVAQKALNDGMTKTAVEDMLSADPKFKQVQQEQGLGKAQEYAKKMTRSATRQEQQTNQPPQQQHGRDQNNNLQR